MARSVRDHRSLALLLWAASLAVRPRGLPWCLAGQRQALALARRAAGCRAGRLEPVLAPGGEGSGVWDARNSASPVVLPPDERTNAWRMWYYGRAGLEWARGVKAWLPTGRIGAAQSEDGVAWTRWKGPLEGGACLDPAPDSGAFDCVHIGVGDVVQWPNGTLWMYYFGGGQDDSPNTGIRMQIGLASSSDGGLSWQRMNGGQPVLPHGGPEDFDALFVAWPRVLPPWKTAGVAGIADGQWYMSYHTASIGAGGISWAAGAAFSSDGFTWHKAEGPVLKGTAPGLWDSKGVGVRSVAVRDGSLVMLYEAVDDAGDHAIGLAESSDGVEWHRCSIPGADAPGGPVLSKGSEADWDGRVVGTPYVLPPVPGKEDWRLYHVGEACDKSGLAIGMARSTGSDLREWSKV